MLVYSFGERTWSIAALAQQRARSLAESVQQQFVLSALIPGKGAYRMQVLFNRRGWTREDFKDLRQVWDSDEVRRLLKLARGLGVSKIILTERSSFDSSDSLGQYFCARTKPELLKKCLKAWDLSSRQLTTVHRTFRNNGDVIILSYEACGDFAGMLAHELAHHINHRLGGLSQFDLFIADFSRVTENMRRVARFDEYYFQNKDEFYAETWARFLCGQKNRTLFRYLDRSLNRLRSKHPEKLIEEHREAA
jgi:hypothetical protein